MDLYNVRLTRAIQQGIHHTLFYGARLELMSTSCVPEHPGG